MNKEIQNDKEEMSHFIQVVSSFANYQNDSEEDIKRIERDFS